MERAGPRRQAMVPLPAVGCHRSAASRPLAALTIVLSQRGSRLLHLAPIVLLCLLHFLVRFLFILSCPAPPPAEISQHAPCLAPAASNKPVSEWLAEDYGDLDMVRPPLPSPKTACRTLPLWTTGPDSGDSAVLSWTLRDQVELLSVTDRRQTDCRGCPPSIKSRSSSPSGPAM